MWRIYLGRMKKIYRILGCQSMSEVKIHTGVHLRSFPKVTIIFMSSLPPIESPDWVPLQACRLSAPTSPQVECHFKPTGWVSPMCFHIECPYKPSDWVPLQAHRLSAPTSPQVECLFKPRVWVPLHTCRLRAPTSLPVECPLQAHRLSAPTSPLVECPTSPPVECPTSPQVKCKNNIMISTKGFQYISDLHTAVIFLLFYTFCIY
jgi:hypothetical protein